MSKLQSRNIIRNLVLVRDSKLRDVAQAVHAELTASTPVDTGWARVNWMYGVDSPPSARAAQELPDTLAPDDAPPWLERAADLQEESLRELMRAVNPRVVYVGNHVPYVGLLDSSRPSPQAAPGWIRRAVARGVRRAGGRGEVETTITGTSS